jgi:hypothetical protein
MVAHRCFDGVRCKIGAIVVDGAEPDDDLTFPVSIKTIVGLGIRSDPADVKKIQQALNRFPSSLGGPVPKLKVDGIVGKFTNAAIEKFQRRQLGFVDFKVEPDKKTIARINQLALTVWVTVNPRIINRVYSDLLPDVHRCALAADAVVLSAIAAFDNPNGVIKPTQSSVDMLNRHFKLDQNRNPRPSLEQIRLTFRDMIALTNRNTQGAERTFVPAPGRFDFAKTFISGVQALTFPHGVALSGFDKAKAQDGSDIQLPRDKIMIFIPFGRSTRDGQVITLLHEMGHYLGGPDGSAELIDDPPSRSSAPSEIAKLPPERMPFIAENYGTFAFEAHFRREPFRLLI